MSYTSEPETYLTSHTNSVSASDTTQTSAMEGK